MVRVMGFAHRAALCAGPLGSTRPTSGGSSGLSSDLAADRILLLVQRALFGAADMAAIEARHEALLVTDHAILGVQPPRLVGRDPALGDAAVDAVVLVGEAPVHLGPAR